MSLAFRSTQPELMDAETLDEAVYNRCIADLAGVNRVTFTHRATLRWLTRATAHLPADAKISVLDVAFGHGDLLRAIAKWAAKRGFSAELSGIDLNPRSAAAASEATTMGNITYHIGDALTYQPAAPVDFIVTSQFTHHLADHEIVSLLRWMDATADRGWLITDIHRHFIPYHGFPILARLMFWHRIVRLDGQVSVARAFTAADWRGLLAQAGISADVKWILPFRHAISRLK